MEAHIDYYFASMLHLNSLQKAKDETDFSEFFKGSGNLYASVSAMIGFVVGTYLPLHVMIILCRHKDFLYNKTFRMKYENMYEGLHVYDNF